MPHAQVVSSERHRPSSSREVHVSVPVAAPSRQPVGVKRPNFLIIMVDQERFPPVYEGPEIAAWRKANLVAQELLRDSGVEFTRHYAAATGCSPSRASIFTGQYPSLHGVTQTTGVGKEAFDSDVFWLDHSTVPTLGHYFRANGYRTFYKGKWHISDADILVPGTHDAFPSYNPQDGVPAPEKERLYLWADRLAPYGFTGWIGPEPHGSSPHNSGSSAAIGVSGRDVVYADEVAQLIGALEREAAASPPLQAVPWVIVASFVNPHDIALFGALTERDPLFRFAVDATVPPIEPPPTLTESLLTKPIAQRSYRDVLPVALQPVPQTDFYRQVYYQLQKNADQQMLRVLQALRNSAFYPDTIVIFLSDHGELLGAHGGLTQKWHCMYEEAIHVPLIFHSPRLPRGRGTVAMPTSHVDLLPTLLALAGIDAAQTQAVLRQNHTEVHPLVGRDLSPLLRGQGMPTRGWEPLYFMTDDDITRGQHQQGPFGLYNSVIQPNHVEAVIASFQTEGGVEVWKYARYFDNPQFWTNPGQQDQELRLTEQQAPLSSGVPTEICPNVTKTQPVAEEIELYNLTADPLETLNLANPTHATTRSTAVQPVLAQLLVAQCQQKRLTPSSGTVPGMPTCDSRAPAMFNNAFDLSGDERLPRS